MKKLNRLAQVILPLYMTLSLHAQTPIVDVDWIDSPSAHLSVTKDKKTFQCYGAAGSTNVRDDASSWVVNHGTAPNPIWARHSSYCTSVQDAATGRWLGATMGNTLGYFLMFYDKDDNLGKAFASKFSLETIVRFDDPKGVYYSGGKDVDDAYVKIVSSQENGGWTLVKYSGQEDLCFEYSVNAGTEAQPVLKNIRLRTGFCPEPGRFYHFVVTVNATATSPSMRLYVNGVLKGEMPIEKLPYLQPESGNPLRQKGMWLCLGGDNAGGAGPDRGGANGRCTFADFKMYGSVLSATQVRTLSKKEEVRCFTDPRRSSGDLLLDVVFGPDQQAADAVSRQPLLKAGSPTIQYNEDLRRYELTCISRTANYFYAPIGAPDVNNQLTDAFSLEVYCKPGTDHPVSKLTAFGFEENGGASLSFGSGGTITFPCHTKGAHGNGKQYVSDAASLTTESRALTTGYTHYVLVYDRLGGTGAHMYVDGKEVANSLGNKVVPTRCDYLSMPYAPYQYICVGGDIKPSTLATACENAFRGNIVSARLWGRALSAGDAETLSLQASATSQTVSVPASGYTTVCLPFAAVVPQGMEAYIVTEGEEVMPLYAKAGDVIPYGTPLILKADAGAYVFEAADLLTATPLAAPEGNLLQGSFASKTIERANIYTFLDGLNQAPAPGTTLPAMSAWLTQPLTLPMGSPESATYLYSICGQVMCQGKGMEGVHVSDGLIVATTDAEGRYTLNSKKKYGYVFMEIPSGYMPAVSPDAVADGTIFPGFWQSLSYPYDAKRVEVHDFQLQPQPNDHHQMVFGADPQFTGKLRQDVSLFKQMVVPRLKELNKEATVPQYSTMLGDLSFDYCWGTFTLQNYRDLLVSQGYPMPHFSVIGNHDHNPWMPPTDSVGFKASETFRTVMGPTYYSFNLGKAHYVVLNNIEYWNVDYTNNHGISLSADQTAWLKKDLAAVDKQSPVFVCMHGPVWKVDKDFNTARWVMSSGDVTTLHTLLKPFNEVHLMTGHHHNLQNMQPAAYPNTYEHTLMAVGGNLWASGDKVGHLVSDDGTPGGYLLFDVDGTDVKWKFVSWQYGEAQFRVIDVNTARRFYETNTKAQAILEEHTQHTDYRKLPENSLLVNVFDYDKKWKVEAYEGGKPLTITRSWLDDVVPFMSADVYYYNGYGKSIEFNTINSTHMFLVQCATPDQPVYIQVTDRFGNIYSRTVERPLACTYDDLVPYSDWDTEDAIDRIFPQSAMPEGAVFDLSGRRVAADPASLHSLPAGVYVIGGRKVVVK